MTEPNPLKRLLPSAYDSLLILAVLFIATAITLPLTGGKGAKPNNIFMTLYLFSTIYLFYGWFWSHGGQTLGMRAWKQKLLSFDGKPVSWRQTFIRLITALPAWSLFLFGLLLWMVPDKIELAKGLNAIPEWLLVLCGFVWVLFENRNNNWRDKLSGTHIVMVNNKKEA